MSDDEEEYSTSSEEEDDDDDDDDDDETEELDLETLYGNFFEFAQGNLVPGGTCDKRQIIYMFRRAVKTKYKMAKNQKIEVTDVDIDLVLKRWNAEYGKAKMTVSPKGVIMYDGFHVRLLDADKKTLQQLEQEKMAKLTAAQKQKQADMAKLRNIKLKSHMTNQLTQLKQTDPIKYAQVMKLQEMAKKAEQQKIQQQQMQQKKLLEEQERLKKQRYAEYMAKQLEDLKRTDPEKYKNIMALQGGVKQLEASQRKLQASSSKLQASSSQLQASSNKFQGSATGLEIV